MSRLFYQPSGYSSDDARMKSLTKPLLSISSGLKYTFLTDGNDDNTLRIFSTSFSFYIVKSRCNKSPHKITLVDNLVRIDASSWDVIFWNSSITITAFSIVNPLIYDVNKNLTISVFLRTSYASHLYQTNHLLSSYMVVHILMFFL